MLETKKSNGSHDWEVGKVFEIVGLIRSMR
jgi:hypothetical protein